MFDLSRLKGVELFDYSIIKDQGARYVCINHYLTSQ
jgi:hypothetical protein